MATALVNTLQGGVVDAMMLSCLTRGQPVIQPTNRLTVRLNIALVDNRQGHVTINSYAPRIVLLDTGLNQLYWEGHWPRGCS